VTDQPPRKLVLPQPPTPAIPKAGLLATSSLFPAARACRHIVE
jgi:hypothetical protein